MDEPGWEQRETAHGEAASISFAAVAASDRQVALHEGTHGGTHGGTIITLITVTTVTAVRRWRCRRRR